jgi:hypothetical protein
MRSALLPAPGGYSVLCGVERYRVVDPHDFA